MKTYVLILILTGFLFITCEKNVEKDFSIGEGLEIYLTEIPYSRNLYLDYSTIDFDTLALLKAPVLRYNDILKYNILNHKVTLKISHDSLKIGEAGVYGRMFVVTIDKNPIYCGFYWPVISSVPCGWVYINEPYFELDDLNDNEFIISFSGEYSDPRTDNRIIDRLKRDRKHI